MPSILAIEEVLNFSYERWGQFRCWNGFEAHLKAKSNSISVGFEGLLKPCETAYAIASGVPCLELETRFGAETFDRSVRD